MTEALSRAFAGDIEVRNDGTGRTIHGIVVPFDRVATVSDGGRPYEESFQMGAFAKHLQERSRPLPLLGMHNSRQFPLGPSTLLREDAAGLYGEFRASKTTAGDEAVELARDGVVSFSVGFKPVKHVKRGNVTVRTEAGLREASLVTFPAYEAALVGGVRSLDDLTEDELLELVARYPQLRSTTPIIGEPESLGTSTDAAPVDEPAEATPLDVSKSFRSLRRLAREKGGPLS